MGSLAEDMTRLQREIRDLRREREALVQNLRGTIPRMLTGFQKAHAQMAERTKAERRASVAEMLAGFRKAHAQMAERTKAERRASVAGIRAGFQKAHAQMAERTKAERQAFVAGLRKQVAELQRGLKADLVSVQQAWYGSGPAEGGGREAAEAQPQVAEAERRRRRRRSKGRDGRRAGG